MIITKPMTETIADLELELERLKRRISTKKPDEIQEEDVDLLKYIYEELKAANSE